MLLLFQLGQLLEPALGRVRFALLYFAALLAASAGAMNFSRFAGRPAWSLAICGTVRFLTLRRFALAGSPEALEGVLIK